MQRPVGTAQAVTGSVFYAEIQMIFGTVCSTFFTGPNKSEFLQHKSFFCFQISGHARSQTHSVTSAPTGFYAEILIIFGTV